MTLEVNVTKKLPNFELNVSFKCRAGNLAAIVGPSGSGKTTLVRIISGLVRPDSGRITFNDKVWVDTDKKIFLPPQKRDLGLVFQDYTLFPHMNVRKNVAFAAKSESKVVELMKLFGISHIAESKPCTISGGERQRAAFCQALAREPVMLLLDEPFSALDADTRDRLRTELGKMKKDLSIPVLHVTHDLGEANELADTILPIVAGRISPEWLKRLSQPHEESQEMAKDMLCRVTGMAV
ncbi:ATP-binding cassette domain-containing protein [Maridesulfovibrio bastinii]|jgi:molybdate transport system ATP-binding protein|uniref:ATP-binding cassette domain-containing protein n=1 Tax=Maridesulfovibrio bastinii TaxID=47157 RepID=UPI0003F5512C|nr:ATP-binding cassette domain-containing protein [Maridesulfovibrio bastinii]